MVESGLKGLIVVYQANVVSVMIASPGDVSKERELIRSIIHETNDLHAANTRTVLLPVGWDTHAAPELAGRPQEIINKKVLDKCDILVGVFWTRLGTPTGEAESGTAEEIKRHIEAGKPAMIYFSSTPVAPGSLDQEQWNALQTFKAWCITKGLVESYDDTSGFVEKFRRQIQILLRDNEYLRGLIEGLGGDTAALVPSEPQTRMVTLSGEAGALLLEAVKGDGEIMNVAFLSGKQIETNGKNFIESNDRRHVAMWEAALEELEELGLVVARGYKREIFEVTARGFQAADSAVPAQGDAG